MVDKLSVYTSFGLCKSIPLVVLRHTLSHARNSRASLVGRNTGLAGADNIQGAYEQAGDLLYHVSLDSRDSQHFEWSSGEAAADWVRHWSKTRIGSQQYKPQATSSGTGAPQAPQSRVARMPPVLLTTRVSYANRPTALPLTCQQ